MSVACDRSLMLVVEEGRSGRGASARSNSNIFYSVGELSEEGVAHRYVPFASTRVCVVRRGKCQGQGGNRSGCDCLSVHKFGGSGEWDVGLWAGLESGLACRRQSPLLRTRQVRGFYIVEGAAWLVLFSVRPGSFQLARVEATWLGVCCAVLVRHLVSNGHVTRGGVDCGTDGAQLPDRVLSTLVYHQDMVGSFLGRELVASRFSIAVPLLPMGRCQDRVSSNTSGPSMTYRATFTLRT